MLTVVLVIHLFLALALIAVVLLQRSEGGALGTLGGGGGGLGLMSSRSAVNLLTRATAVLATCFMGTSIILAVLNSGSREGDRIEAPGPALDAEAPAEDESLPIVPLSR